MSELEPGYSPEVGQQEEAEKTDLVFDIETLLTSLEFTETEEMAHIHALLVDAIRVGNEEQRVQLYYEYCDQMEKLIVSSPNVVEAQIAGDLAVAGIFKESGNITRYVEELQNALQYADGMGMTELVDKLQSEIEAYR